MFTPPMERPFSPLHEAQPQPPVEQDGNHGKFDCALEPEIINNRVFIARPCRTILAGLQKVSWSSRPLLSKQ